MLSKGNHLVLASGRSYDSILDVLALLDLPEKDLAGSVYMAAYNGALLYDCTKQAVIAHSPNTSGTGDFRYGTAKGHPYSDLHRYAYCELCGG